MTPPCIALVSPPYYRGMAWAKGEGPPFNIGLGYLASFIQPNGYDSDLFDFSCLRNKRVEKLVEDYDLNYYDVVGFSVYSHTYEITSEIASEIKKRNRKTTIVFGGPHATGAGEDIILHDSHVDFVVRGEGEIPFQNLIYCIESGMLPYDVEAITFRDPQGQVVSNPLLREYPALDSLPFPRRFSENGATPFFNFYCEKDKVRKTAASISVSRGCPYKCAFCIFSLSQRNYRTRSAKSVLKEIQQLYEEHNFEHVWFVDATFLIDPEKALRIGKGLKKINKNFTWNCTGRADLILRVKNVLPKLIDYGLVCVEIGIESGSEAVLKRWNKGTTVEINRDALLIMNELELNVGLDFIMFDPSSTKEELKDNILFLRDAGFYGYTPVDVLTSEIRLYPSTPLREFYSKRWGKKWNSNIIPSYRFENKKVRDIHSLVTYFEEKFLNIFNGFVHVIGNILYKMITHENYRKRKFPDYILKKLQELQLSQHVISIIPYLIFERIVVDGNIKRKSQIYKEINNLIGMDILEYLEWIANECRFFNKYFGIE